MPKSVLRLPDCYCCCCVVSLHLFFLFCCCCSVLADCRCGCAGAAVPCVRMVGKQQTWPPKLWCCLLTWIQFLTGRSRHHDWIQCDRCYPLSCGTPVFMISESRDDHPNRSTGLVEQAGKPASRKASRLAPTQHFYAVSSSSRSSTSEYGQSPTPLIGTGTQLCWPLEPHARA